MRDLLMGRIVSGDRVKNFLVHGPSSLVLAAGSNAIEAESGSNPRDTSGDTSKGIGLSVETARQLLREKIFFHWTDFQGRLIRDDKEANKMNEAVSSFRQGLFGCSQAIVVAYGGKLGIDNDLTIRTASVFGRGMGVGGMCGAVTGALMLIGARYGSATPGDIQAAEKAVGTAGDFINEFVSIHKTVNCRELINCDVNTSEGLKYALDTGIIENLCSKFVEDAAVILEKYL